MDIEELKALALEIDSADIRGLVYPPSRIADVISPRLRAIIAKLEALERGEFICKSCGHRKDADASKIDPPF